jgi:two-component system, NtrC family, sensor kinase
LALFAATMISAMILVHITIRRSILQPLSQVQSDLAHERDLLRILLDHIPDYIYFKDARGKFVRINQALAPVLGVARPEDAIGRSDADFFDPETTALIQADDAQIRASGKPVISKIELLRRSGKSRWVATTKMPVTGGMPPEQMIVGISRDVTQWKNTVGELERSEKSFRLLFSAIPHAIFACDLETLEILEVNDAACRTYGYSPEEFHHLRLTDIYPRADHARLRRTVQELGPAKPWRGFRKHVTRDGRVLDVEVTDHFLEFHGRRTILVTAQDISEQKRLEIELQQAQRLEAVGQLAAGIAHEINTPIQYVGDNLRFLCDTFHGRQKVLGRYERLVEAALSGEASGPVVEKIIEEIRAVQQQTDAQYLEREIPRALEQSLDGVDRVATIVRAMKAFAHPGGQEKKPADLNKALSDALIVARNELKYVADVETDFGDLPPVWCHIGDLNQVFLNLLVNAAHAIGEVVKTSGGRGKICVRTRRQKDEAVVSVSDTGCGIPADIQERVFDPFFTTKEVGKGTGQGLAIARNIVVEKHGGRIAFEPNLPQGTTFVVSLPTDEARPANPQAATAPEEQVS